MRLIINDHIVEGTAEEVANLLTLLKESLPNGHKTRKSSCRHWLPKQIALVKQLRKSGIPIKQITIQLNRQFPNRTRTETAVANLLYRVK